MGAVLEFSSSLASAEGWTVCACAHGSESARVENDETRRRMPATISREKISGARLHCDLFILGASDSGTTAYLILKRREARVARHFKKERRRNRFRRRSVDSEARCLVDRHVKGHGQLGKFFTDFGPLGIGVPIEFVSVEEFVDPGCGVKRVLQVGIALFGVL